MTDMDLVDALDYIKEEMRSALRSIEAVDRSKVTMATIRLENVIEQIRNKHIAPCVKCGMPVCPCPATASGEHYTVWKPDASTQNILHRCECPPPAHNDGCQYSTKASEDK